MTSTRRSLKWRALVTVVCAAAVLLQSACGSLEPTPAAKSGLAASPALGITPSPTYDPNEFALTPVLPVATKWPLATPAPQPTPNPDDGVGFYANVDFAPPPALQEFATWYGMYVAGRVTEILPAQWSTPDGKRPPGITESDVWDNTYTIITPVVITLDGPPLLDRYGVDVSSGRIVVAAFGGKIGKDEIDTNDPSQHPQVGDHILLGVSDRPYMGTKLHVPYWTPAGPAWTLGMVYWLESDGLALARMPSATPVATQDLIQAIKDAAQASP